MAAIHHISLELCAADVDASVHFWALLGFVQTTPPAEIRDRAVWLRAAHAQIHLLVRERPVVAPEGHVAVVLGDAYESILEALAQAGHAIDPRRPHWGSPRAYASAPGGHRVELMCTPPP
ncbi:MAG: hypothetical protein DLM63_01980 [Solirubrobacterales bacterium]|nr:MAG: hypothetical protein DLM63_01980 [Solirubrobacterales bacterium]